MATDHLLIRSATRGDAVQLSMLAQRVFISTYGAALTDIDPQPFLEASFSAAVFTHLLTNSDDHLLVAIQSDRMIGYVRVARNPLPSGLAGSATLELAQLYLDPAYHGRGAAAMLLSAACHYAQSIGVEAIWLCAWKQNHRALRFYEKSGFTIIGHCAVYVDQVVFQDVVMLRRLPHAVDS